MGFLNSTDEEIARFVKRLGVDPAEVTRVIVDIQMSEPVMVYVEKIVSRGSLDIITEADLAPKVVVV